MKILVLANNDGGLFGFRKELLAELAKTNEIVIAVPSGKHQSYFEQCGYKYIDVPVDRRGMNIFKDFVLYRKYRKLIRNEKPDLVITYTIKCNIYGGIAAKKGRIDYVANITGVGSALQNESLLKKLVVLLYKYAMCKSKRVFFQNEENMNLMQGLKIVDKEKSVLLNGSGVNLHEYTYLEPTRKDVTIFLFVGRIMREKGIDELLNVAEKCKNNGIKAEFELIGRCEEDYVESLRIAEKKGIIRYYGYQENIKSYIQKSDCVILPSYHEGMSNALLEGAAMGRAILASDIAGCRETLIDGETGMLFKKQDVEDMYEKVVKFTELSPEEKIDMGIKGRKHVEQKFDRQDIISTVAKSLQ